MPDIKVKADKIIPYILKDKPQDKFEIGEILNENDFLNKILKFYQKLKISWNNYALRKDMCPIVINWKVIDPTDKPTFNCTETLELFKYCNTSGNYLNKILVSVVKYV